MQEIISLNQRVRKLCVGNPRAALANPRLHKLPVQQLRHGKRLPNLAQKIQVFNLPKPIQIIYHHQLRAPHDVRHLARNRLFIPLHFL